MLQDWSVNRGNARIRAALVIFRAAQWSRLRLGRKNAVSRLLAFVYRAYGECVGSFELPVSTQVGPRLKLWHGFGVVINKGTVIGSDVTLRQHVTLGNDGRTDGCPVIGNGVEVGAGATVVGPVTIGDGASIGAHSLVTRDVPAHGRTRIAPSQTLPGVTGQSGMVPSSRELG